MIQNTWGQIKGCVSIAWSYIRTLLKWLPVAIVIGIICGMIGALFHMGVQKATELREIYPWLLWCLPVAGLVITGFYKITRTEGQGTDDIIDQVRKGKPLSFYLLPAIFLGTVLTHLCGGSAGREGAALQMGGTIGYRTGRLCHLDDRDTRTATVAGMAAFFSALFGTPLAATVFAETVISVGMTYHAAFIPALAASLTSYGISLRMGVKPTEFIVEAPDLDWKLFCLIAILSIVCALASVLFCETIHVIEHQFKKRIPNPWIRVLVGGVLIILLTYLFGTRDYNGAGMDIITLAIEQGIVHTPIAFLLKILLTAITLGTGFKGGEVVPSFFTGAVLGCALGPILGIPAGFAAAIGLIAVFCGAVNCPVASILLSVELFGDDGLLYFALACAISYMLSGYSGIYSSQTIVTSKLKAQYINVYTNSHRTGDDSEKI